MMEPDSATEMRLFAVIAARTIRRITMVKRTSLEKAECPIARSLDAIGDWWSLLIIRDAFLGIRRFSEFQKNIGLAKNILTVRLRTLVDQGILKTAPASDGSAYQGYVLTPKGRGVFPVLVALRQWSEEFSGEPDGFATRLVDRNNGRPVRKLELRSRDGRLLGDGDTELRPNPRVQNRVLLKNARFRSTTSGRSL
jgi:DNA-binding HxlR family transcriptional regulator